MTAIQGHTFKWCVARIEEAPRVFMCSALKSSFRLLSFIISSVLAQRKIMFQLSNVEMRMENAQGALSEAGHASVLVLLA